MIRLHQYPPAFGLPSLSPFCIKVETYLRMARLPFESVVEINPARGPRGRMPFINDEGAIIPDSDAILEHLERKFQGRLDARLDAQTRAQIFSVRRALDQDLIRVILYSRWVDPRGWHVLRKEFLGFFPFGLRRLALRAIRQSLVSEARGNGSLELPQRELYELGSRYLRSLRDLLGDKPFLFGAEPTTADAAAYAFLAVILRTPIDVPLREELRAMDTLVAYCSRIDATYFGSQLLGQLSAVSEKLLPKPGATSHDTTMYPSLK